jgi:hypothetical protein
VTAILHVGTQRVASAEQSGKSVLFALSPFLKGHPQGVRPTMLICKPIKYIPRFVHVFAEILNFALLRQKQQ